MTRKNYILCAVLLADLLFVLLSLGVVHADTQINLATNPGAHAMFFARSDESSRNAQAFTPGINVSALSFYGFYAKEGTGYTGNAILAVQGDIAGHPSGVDLGTASIAAVSSFPTDNSTECSGTQAAVLSATTTVSLAAGTTYWIIVRSDTADTSGSQVPYQCGTTYSPEALSQLGMGSWSAVFSPWGFSGTIFLTEGPAPEPTGGVATSSVDQTQQNVWEGWWTFFAMLVFVVWLGRSQK